MTMTRKTVLFSLVALATLSAFCSPIRSRLASAGTSCEPSVPFDPSLGFTEGIYLNAAGQEVASPDSFVTRHIPVTHGVLTFRSPIWDSGQLPNNRGYFVQYDRRGTVLMATVYFRASSASGLNPVDITIVPDAATVRFCCGRSHLYSERYPLWARYGEDDYLIWNWKLVERRD